MKKQILEVIKQLLIDVVFGLVAAVFAYFLLGTIIPQMVSTSVELMDGAVKFKFLVDSEKMKQIFSIWNNFCVLFGIRFVVAYITGSYHPTKSEIKESKINK